MIVGIDLQVDLRGASIAVIDLRANLRVDINVVAPILPCPSTKPCPVEGLGGTVVVRRGSGWGEGEQWADRPLTRRPRGWPGGGFWRWGRWGWRGRWPVVI